MIAYSRIPIVLFGLGLSLAYAGPIVESDIDHDNQPLQRVYLIVQPPQPTFMGASPELSYVSEPGQFEEVLWFGPADHLGLSSAATAIQAAFVLADKWRFEVESSEENDLYFAVDYAGLNASLLDDIDSLGDWEIAQLSYVPFYDVETHITNLKGPIRRALNDREIDLAMSIRSSFYLSPTLNQVRVLVETRIESKKEHHRLPAAVAIERNYEYLSPAAGTALRNWNHGEREARIAAIESAFENSVTNHPENRDAYERDRSAALAFLENSDTIPPAQAVREFWSTEKLQSEYEHGSSILNRVIRRDLQSLTRDDYPESRYEAVPHLDRDGDSTRITMRVVGSIDQQVIYRDKTGSLIVRPQS